MMTFQNSKNIISAKVLNGLTDYHCQIIPGIEKNNYTLINSLEAIKYFESLGIKRIILTPKINAESGFQNTEDIYKQFKLLNSNYNGKIQLQLGGIYLFNNKLIKQLKEKSLFLVDKKFLFFEIPEIGIPSNFSNLVRIIHSFDYQCVFVHPERYQNLTMNDYENIQIHGILFQLDILSLVGAYGYDAKKKAKILLKNDFYDFIGTNFQQIDTFNKWIYLNKLSKKTIDKLMQLKIEMYFFR